VACAPVAATARALADAVPAAVNGRPAPEPAKFLVGDDTIDRDISYPTAPFLGPRTIESIPLQSVFPYINEITLFQFQWGYRRKGKPQKDYQRQIDKEVRPILHDLARKCAKEKILEPKAAYGFWRCVAEGDSLALLHPSDESREVARFTFPRQ